MNELDFLEDLSDPLKKNWTITLTLQSNVHNFLKKKYLLAFIINIKIVILIYDKRGQTLIY